MIRNTGDRKSNPIVEIRRSLILIRELKMNEFFIR
jgi:hypothetical protein